MLNQQTLFSQNGNVKALQRAYIDALIQRERARMETYLKARDYYDGSHDTKLTDRLQKFLHVSADSDFTVNYCPMVVNAKADRLKVTGFETDDDQAETLWDWWRKNRMDRVQGIVHRAAIRDGDAYVLVEWDNEAKRPRFYFEPAYAGEGVMVYYSEERREDIEFASKSWQIKYGTNVGKMRRMNLYFPDRIEKYVSHDDTAMGNWMPYLDDETILYVEGRLGQAGVVWWTDNREESGKPLGVPIVHFKHNDTGDPYGTSHLAKVMPVQDALNKSMIDLLATMDAAGFGLLVGLGSVAWSQVKVAPGAIAALDTKPENASLERLPGENPVGLLAVYNALVMEIARISGTPMSYFQSSGQVAAEGTMKQQEVALIAQVQKAQTDFGNGWENCMMIARRLENAFGENSLDDETIIDTVWAQAETRNDKEFAETQAIHVSALGKPEEQAWIELGYDDDDIKRFHRDKKRKLAENIRNMAKLQNAPNGENDPNMTQTETDNEQPATAA